MPAKKISIPLLFGLIAAGVMTLTIFGTWLAGPEAFLGWPVWLGKSLVILLAAMAAAAQKRVMGGILDFRSALRAAFGVMVMGIVAANFFVWLIVNMIDPHFYQRLLPVILKNAESKYRMIGAPEDQIRAQLDYMRTDNQFSLGSVIFGMGRDLLIFGILSILIAVTVRSKKVPPQKPESQKT
jgi:Protein of unknown function (DUF4199)